MIGIIILKVLSLFNKNIEKINNRSYNNKKYIPCKLKKLFQKEKIRQDIDRIKSKMEEKKNI
jgi:hypothetical protein